MEKLTGTVKWIITKVNKIRINFKFRKKSEETCYSDLMPKDEVKKVETYHKALDWAINKNSRIKNIALSGPYGSGKSTIIESYMKKAKVKKCKFLRISLATFNVDGNEKIDKHKLIEKSILEQMIYRIDGKKAPFSRFKKINKVSKKTILANLVVWLILLGNGWLLYKKVDILKYQQWIEAITFNNMIQSFKDEWLKFMLTLLFVNTFLIVSYNLIKLLISGVKVSKVKYDKTEIEISKDSQESIYNKYLDELLYFFEETKYEIVVFEDIDRFDNPAIFISLREINTLLNNYEKIKRRIIFLYAIKDDMFSDKERTKFFDFIIPVIPFVDAYNSRQIVLDKFEKLSDAEIKKPTERLIKDITIFLDDMRMLTNIINEYIIYYKQINDSLIDADKLFSIIVYKNLYPKDFFKLQYNEGIVKSIFDKKNEIIEQQIQKLEETINSINAVIKTADDKLLNSLEDLNSVFVNHWKKRGIAKIDTGNGSYNALDITSDIISRKQEFNPNDTVTVYLNNSYSTETYTYDDFFTAFGAYKNYFVMAEAIELRNKETMQEYKRKLSEYQNAKNELRLISLQKLVKNYNDNEIFEQIKEEALLIFLLRRGKIDESYRRYISYFYPGAVTQGDMLFLRCVKSCIISLGYDYKLNKISEIIKDILVDEFKSEAILNNDLFNYLFDNIENEIGILNIIIRGIVENINSRIEFVDQFCEKSEHKGLLINEISKIYPRFWSFIVNEFKPSDIKIDRYFKIIMNVCSVDDIVRMNEADSIKRFIESTPHILQIEYEAIAEENIKRIIDELNIEFYQLINPKEKSSNVNELELEDKLIVYILENKKFKINEEMVKYFYGYLVNYDDEKMKLFESKNYTAIKLLQDKNLSDYIEGQLEKYLINVFLKLPNNIDEELNQIEGFLKNEELDINTRIQIISKVNCVIRNLRNTPVDLWNTIIEYSKWDITWFNIACYYEHFGMLNNKIIEQLNNREICKKLAITKIDKIEGINEFTEDVLDKMYQYLYINEDICDSYFNIIQNAISNYYEFENTDLSDKRIKLILDGNSMEFNKNNLVKLRNNYNELWYNWTLSNIDAFVDLSKQISLEINEIKKYLYDDKIKIGTKVKLANANKEIITDNFDDVDVIIQMVKIYKESDIGELDSYILEKLISPNGYEDIRIEVVSNLVSNLNEHDINMYLSIFGEPLNKLVEQRNTGEVFLSYNTHNLEKLLNNLVSCNYIKAYIKIKNGYKVSFDTKEISA